MLFRFSYIVTTLIDVSHTNATNTEKYIYCRSYGNIRKNFVATVCHTKHTAWQQIASRKSAFQRTNKEKVMQYLWKTLNIFEESIMVIGMFIMVSLNFLNIVCRYLLPQTPFSYTEELIVLVFVWTSMFGISYGYRLGSHTALTIFVDKFKGIGQQITIVIATLASAILMLILAYTGYGMVHNQIRFSQILPGMQISVAFVGIAIPLGAAVCCLSILRSGYMEILTLKNAAQKD